MSAFPAAVRRILAEHPDDHEERMLHSPGVRTGDRFYAFAPANALVVKLPAHRVTELVDGGRGEPCPPRPGNPMKEWVRIASPDEEECLSYLLEARTFVLGEDA